MMPPPINPDAAGVPAPGAEPLQPPPPAPPAHAPVTFTAEQVAEMARLGLAARAGPAQPSERAGQFSKAIDTFVGEVHRRTDLARWDGQGAGWNRWQDQFRSAWLKLNHGVTGNEQVMIGTMLQCMPATYFQLLEEEYRAGSLTSQVIDAAVARRHPHVHQERLANAKALQVQSSNDAGSDLQALAIFARKWQERTDVLAAEERTPTKLAHLFFEHALLRQGHLQDMILTTEAKPNLAAHLMERPWAPHERYIDIEGRHRLTWQGAMRAIYLLFEEKQVKMSIRAELGKAAPASTTNNKAKAARPAGAAAPQQPPWKRIFHEHISALEASSPDTATLTAMLPHARARFVHTNLGGRISRKARGPCTHVMPSGVACGGNHPLDDHETWCSNCGHRHHDPPRCPRQRS